MAAAMASLACELRPTDPHSSSCASSDESKLGRPVMASSFIDSPVVLAPRGCAVLMFSAV